MSVSDLDTGKVLYEQNATRCSTPRRRPRTFTSAATLDRLGKNHRFRTPVVRLGDVSASGTLRGRLALVASGDLTMGGRALPNGGVAYTGFDHMDANEVPGHATLTPQNPLAGLDSLAQHSEDPAALVAAFTRFEPLEAITSLLYTSQLDG